MKIRISIVGLCFSLNAFAAPQKNTNIKMALDMPLQNRLQIFKTQGPSAVTDLEATAFNENATLSERWRAITVLARVFPGEAQGVLEKAIKSPEWYIRNAVAVGLKYSERSWAILQARILMHDPALVVRTSAVMALKDMGAIETEELLWEKLYSSENYNNGQSLWIRKHIAETLAGFAPSGKEKSFIKMLNDKDKDLHTYAVTALNRMSGSKKSRTDWLNH